MKSKIKIDLDGSNNPVIMIELSNDTADLRDKALKRFIEGIGLNSNALFIRQPYAHEMSSPFSIYEIYPFLTIDDTVLYREHANMFMRFEAENLLAKSLGFARHSQEGGITLWEDSDGCLWRWEKYGFGKLDRHVSDQIIYKKEN